MSYFLNDSLADTNGTLLQNHTGGDGTTWAQLSGFSGVATIESNAVTFNSAYSVFAASETPPSANYSVAATVATNGSTTGLGGVCARLQSNGSGYALVCHGSTLYLYRFSSGANQNTLDSYAFTPGSSQTIRLVVNGSNISGYLNGNLVVSAVDSNVSSAGSVGIYGNTGSVNSWAISGIQALDGGADGAVFVNVTNSNLVWSPQNWYFNGTTYAQTNNSGAYLKFCCGATTYVSVKVDVSPLVAASATSGEYPILRTYFDSSPPYTGEQMASTTTQYVFSGLTSGTHYFQIGVEQFYQTLDRWNTPSNVLRITQIVIDNGASILTPAGWVTPRPNTAIAFGDSIGEGFGTLDALQSPVASLAPLLNAEVGNICFAGQGYVNAGTSGSNVPSMVSAMGYYFSGASRLVGGVLSPAPNYVVILQGQNGSGITSAQVTSSLASVRAIAPSSTIIVVTPFSGQNAAAIAGATPPDNNCKIVDLSNFTANLYGFGGSGYGEYNTVDGLHPNAVGQTVATGMLGLALAQAIPAQGQGPNATTLTVTSDGSTPVSGAVCYISSDSAGQVPITGPLVTNSSGQITANLTTGNTYYLTATYESAGSISKVLSAVSFTA